MQVRLLTNMSDPFPEKIVRERLTQSSAFYLERLLPFVYFWGMGLLAIFFGAGIWVENGFFVGGFRLIF